MTLGICSANISIGVINLMASQVLSIENNRIIGIMGQCFDQFLVHKGIRCVYRIDSSSKLIPRRLLIDFLTDHAPLNLFTSWSTKFIRTKV